MTLEEIEKISKDLLSAEDVASFLWRDPQSIRDQAHKDPEKLGFAVIVIGSRVLIPRLAFISFMKMGTPRYV
jgi:hypothetical protein